MARLHVPDGEPTFGFNTPPDLIASNTTRVPVAATDFVPSAVTVSVCDPAPRPEYLWATSAWNDFAYPLTVPTPVASIDTSAFPIAGASIVYQVTELPVNGNETDAPAR